MQRVSSWAAAQVAALSLLALAGPGSAAQITQISYDVTSGTFSGPNSTGPITGGSLVYTPPGGVVSTPGNFPGGYLFLTLTGPSGSFSALVDAGLAILNSLNAAWLFTDTNPVGLSGASPLAKVFGSVSYPPGGTYPYLIPQPVGGSVLGPQLYNFGHDFQIGNEVRTMPEPSAAPLLGLGLLGFAAVGGRAVRAKRRS